MAQSFNGSQQVSTFINGMNLDNAYSVLSDQSYTYGMNVRLVVNDKEGYGSIQAIEGFKKLNEESGINFKRYFRDFDTGEITYEYAKFDLSEYEIIGLISIRDYTCIFTKSLSKEGYNYIFRVILKDDIVDMTQISSGFFNIGNNVNNISLVSYWEDFDNIKVYWTDGVNLLRFINISESKDEDNFDKDLDYFNSIPTITVHQPELYKFTSGSLKVGMIQYCYQLFTKNGSESRVSSLSSLYHLTNSLENSKNYKGASVDKNSGKSITMKFKIDDDQFDKCRVYSLHYSALDEDPIIRIVSEFEINLVSESTGEYQYFTDPGSYLSEISLAEFLALDPYYFIPRAIESKGNRLFAANIIEDSWNLPDFDSDNWYDTRVFRFANDSTNNVHSKITSLNNSEIIIKPEDLISPINEWKELVPYNHDCINPFNSQQITDYTNLNETYQHILEDNNIGMKGGSGRNISYKIIHTKFGEDYYTNFPASEFSFWDNRNALQPYGRNPGLKDDIFRRTLNGIQYERFKDLDLYYNIPEINNDSSTYSSNRLKVNENFTNYNRINYSNPILDSRYRSYQRDEIYRFGVVFYNKRGQNSPVNWIGDIRMPSMLDKDHRLFDNYGVVRTDVATDNVYQIVTYPMGIEFEFKNIPVDVTQIEIVRCKRNYEDRTVLTQGIISKTVKERDDQSSGTSRPLSSMTYGNQYASTIRTAAGTMDERYTCVDYTTKLPDFETLNIPYLLTSPEISYYGEDMSDYFESDVNIQVLYGMTSPMRPELLSGYSDFELDIYINNTFVYLNQYWFNNRESVFNTKNSDDNIQEDRMDGMSVFSMKVSDNPFTDNHTYEAGPLTLLTTGFNKRDEDNDRPENKVKLVSKLFNPFTNYTAEIVDKQGNKTYEERSLIQDNTILNITNSKFIPALNPDDYEDINDGLNKKTIGSTIYQNWVVNKSFYDDKIKDKKQKNGNHGPVVAFTASDVIFNLPSIYKVFDDGSKYFSLVYGISLNNSNSVYNKALSYSKEQKERLYTLNSTFLANMKKSSIPYGGDSYSARSNSTYISTNFIIDNFSNNSIIQVFGGDTYIGITEYINQHWYYIKSDPKDDESGDRGQKAQIVTYYPCESSINHHMVQGSNFFRYANDEEYPYEIQPEPYVSVSGFIQESPLYSYNSVYSVENTNKVFIPKGMYTEDNKNIDFRIQYSEAKTNDEISDSWLKYKVANYLDVDTKYGSINNLKTFNNTLYYWQTDAFGALSVAPTSLITDDNSSQLILGKGDVLDDYSYITTTNGSKENIFTNNVTSPSALYWYDYDRNELVTFTGNDLTPISKSKSIQSYLNSNKNNISDDIQMLYDKKYNEVQFRFRMNDDNKNNHIIFNELIDAFTSYYSYDTDWFIDLKDNYYSIKDNEFYKHNSSKLLNKFFTNNQEISELHFVVNANYLQTKTFDNVEYSGDFNDSNNFNTIIFRTDKQDSQTINKEDIQLLEDNFRFSIPRNEVKVSNYSTIAPSYNDRMRGKYLISEYIFKPNNGDTVFRIPYIKTSYRISNI